MQFYIYFPLLAGIVGFLFDLCGFFVRGRIGNRETRKPEVQKKGVMVVQVTFTVVICCTGSVHAKAFCACLHEEQAFFLFIPVCYIYYSCSVAFSGGFS